MPLAALFIGGVLPVLLSRLIIERARLYGSRALINMQFRMILINKYNLELKKKIQPEVESFKLQASSGKP